MAKSKATMTPKDASRIQSNAAKANGGVVKKGSFASRATSAGDRNSSNGARRK